MERARAIHFRRFARAIFGAARVLFEDQSRKSLWTVLRKNCEPPGREVERGVSDPRIQVQGRELSRREPFD